MNHKCTRLTSTKPLTKQFTKDSQTGEITKSNPKFWEGELEVMTLNGLEGLKDTITQLNTNEALTYTTPIMGLESGKITTKGNEDLDEGIISRSKDCFHYAPEPGYLFIDVDDDLTLEEVMARLTDLYDGFKDVTFLYVTSASNGINGKKGFHLYCSVSDCAIIPQAMNNLFKMAFIKGYGYYKVYKGGAAHPRTFFDKAVYDPARLDFIAGPVCRGFDAPARDIKLINYNGNKEVALDLIPLLRDFGAKEIKKTEKIMAEEKAKVKPEIVKEQTKECKRRGMKLCDYQTAMETQILSADFILPDGTKVADLLNESRDAYNDGISLQERSICHPTEGGHEEKTKLYFNDDGSVSIHSFKHGGKTWKLKHTMDTVGDSATLKVLHGLTRQEDMERLPVHPETKYVMKMIKTTYAGWGKQVPEDTMEDMISLYLNMILEKHKGCYSIGLQPSGGKTQAILHIAWYIGEYHPDKSICIAFQQKKDIDEAYDFLSSKEIDVVFSYSKRGDRTPTPLGELVDHQVLLHTHYKIRSPYYDELFYTFNQGSSQGSYKVKPRDLMVFDEAYFGTLTLQDDLSKVIGKLAMTVASERQSPKGLPVEWIMDLQRRLERANELVGNQYKVPYRDVLMPRLSSRFIQTAWRVKGDDELCEFLSRLFTIASSDENYMRVTREAGATAILTYKANQPSYYDKMINTDATRDVRTVHELSPQQLIRYPVREEPRRKQRVYYVTGISDSKSAMDINANAKDKHKVKELYELKTDMVTSWIKEMELKEVGVVQSQYFPPLPGTVNIPYGQHKQTNRFNKCDGMVIMHQFRVPGHVYKNNLIAEGRLTGPVNKGFLRAYEVGSLADETIQAMERGSSRNGEECPTLIFLNDMKLLDKIKAYYPIYEFKEYSTDNLKIFNETPETERKKRKEEMKNTPRVDKIYENRQEKDWGRRFKTAMKKEGIEDPQGLLEKKYLRDKRNGINMGPGKWLRCNVELKDKQPLTHSMKGQLDGLLSKGNSKLQELLNVKVSISAQVAGQFAK